MKLLGFQIPNYTFPGVTNDKLFEHVVMLASTAEKAGFDSVWVMDHFYQLPNIGPRTDQTGGAVRGHVEHLWRPDHGPPQAGDS
jgi:alkanesulfonate monooxygenase SsuD/methylene tetrahydromethanopterin reductase-like flavin-dependent oxidoreductase (luciferase family)